LRNGKDIDVNGKPTLETDETCMIVEHPLDHPRFVRWLPFSQGFMDNYTRQLIDGRAGASSQFEYDYNERLRHYTIGEREVDQLQYIIDELSRSLSSRRAVAITWKPNIDTGLDDVPCLQLVQCVLRDGRLHMKVVFRSNDMLLAAGANMYALTEAQECIRKEIEKKTNCNITLGTYTHISLVPHIYYKRDADYLKGVI
jgi:thymidylate synthase